MYTLIRTDYFESPNIGFVLVVKDIVDYANDYARYVKFGSTATKIGAFVVTEEGCDTDNPYRFFVAGTANNLNTGGYTAGGDLMNFVAKFSIFEGGTTLTTAETVITSEHYGYDLYAFDSEAAIDTGDGDTEFLVRKE